MRQPKKKINSQRKLYENNLLEFIELSNEIQKIKTSGKETDDKLPTWNNGFLPGLDIICLYGMMVKYKPDRYIEIGSGNSTKVARKAIGDFQLHTNITSIDPFPRTEIEGVADEIVRMPLERMENYGHIMALNAGDILFIDNSHRVFPNSDAAICFLEILPFLKPGVIVHIHDIYLPFDYPQFMCDRFYNEQYMLAALLLSNPERYQVIMPNFFISEDDELSQLLTPLWNHPNLEDVERHGGSFWIKINSHAK